MPKILKFSHQWSWAIQIVGYIFIFGTIVGTRENASANNTSDIAAIILQHKEENLAPRMASQEESTKNIKDSLVRIENIQGKLATKEHKLSQQTILCIRKINNFNDNY